MYIFYFFFTTFTLVCLCVRVRVCAQEQGYTVYCPVHVLAVHPNRLLCCLPIVLAPHTLVCWNNANNYPPLYPLWKEWKSSLSDTSTRAHSPVCQTAWQKPYNHPITWWIFTYTADPVKVNAIFIQLLLCLSDHDVSMPLHLNLEVCN